MTFPTKNKGNSPPPAQGEGETNNSARRQAWARANIGPATRGLLTRDARAFMHQSVPTPCLSVVRKAQGIWIEDTDGRRYMDFHGNNVHHIGYGHPRLKRAISAQMDELCFAPRRFASTVAVELAEKLAEIAPGTLSKILLATGGSDAIEIALKIARAATGRHKTLSFWDAFHGAGFGAASIGGEQMFRHSQFFGPLLEGTEHVPPFGGYRNPFGIADSAQHSADEQVGRIVGDLIAYTLEKAGDIGAFIAEPNRAVPFIAPRGFWRAVRAACDANGTLLIFDEIPTGLGKTGAMFACDHDGVVPDILVLGKALGGGILPIAATICRPELDVGAEFAIGHYTHEKNPVTARAALTTLQIIEDEGLVENAAKVGAHALERLGAMKDRLEIIGDVRGRGLLLGIELVRDRDTKEPAVDAAEAVLYRCLDAGLSFKISLGSVLTLTPPLTVTRDEMDQALGIIEAALSEVT
ncbi:MAG: (R)-1-hydroxy-2-aminoethylphosphonate ammonia-lyase [Alphaproteobacteria bacterium]